MSTTPGENTVGQIGYGTKFYYNVNASSGTFVQCGEIVDIKPPKRTATPVVVERYDAPSPTEEIIPEWVKPGDLELMLIYTLDQQTALDALLNQRCQFGYVKPDGNGKKFAGIMTESGEAVPIKDKMTNSYKFAVSGSPSAFNGSSGS